MSPRQGDRSAARPAETSRPDGGRCAGDSQELRPPDTPPSLRAGPERGMGRALACSLLLLLGDGRVYLARGDPCPKFLECFVRVEAFLVLEEEVVALSNLR